VRRGAPLLTLHTDEPERFERALASLEGAYEVSSDARFEPRGLILDRIDAS
jgi:thymidine phosphorylase